MSISIFNRDYQEESESAHSFLIISFALGIISCTMILISLFLPWYSIYYVNIYTMKSYVKFFSLTDAINYSSGFLILNLFCSIYEIIASLIFLILYTKKDFYSFSLYLANTVPIILLLFIFNYLSMDTIYGLHRNYDVLDDLFGIDPVRYYGLSSSFTYTLYMYYGAIVMLIIMLFFNIMGYLKMKRINHSKNLDKISAWLREEDPQKINNFKLDFN
ncbi:MAG: hypothetical protein ACFE9Z_11740 [Promethearchaeota archaeon]